MKESLTSITEQISLPIIQALECLAIYWFGVGNPNNGDLCLSKCPCHSNYLTVMYTYSDATLN